jgi:hypothetical protein
MTNEGMLILKKDTTVINYWPLSVRLFEGEVDTTRFKKAVALTVSFRRFLKRVFFPAVAFFTILKTDPDAIPIHPN